jgi:hypothetical protein
MWRILLMPVVAVWAFACSRGHDGSPAGVAIGAVVIGCGYLLIARRENGLVRRLCDLVALESAAALGLFLDNQLDEMGEMINWGVPLVIAGWIAVLEAIKLAQRLGGRGRSEVKPSADCPRLP